jgi:hypothetical protein
MVSRSLIVSHEVIFLLSLLIRFPGVQVSQIKLLLAPVLESALTKYSPWLALRLTTNSEVLVQQEVVEATKYFSYSSLP